MATPLDTPDSPAAAHVGEAAPAEAPRNLLGRPATRHRGTDLDGATLAPQEALRVRGLDLNALIGATSFEGAIAHLWFDLAPGDAAHEAREAEIRARLAALSAGFAGGSAAQTVAASMGAAGVAPVFAAAAGLLRGLDDALARAAGTPLADADLEALLACAAAAPFLLHAAIAGRPCEDPAAADASSHARRMLVLTGATRRDPAALAAMDALLVAWHAGFGYITPTVLAPRVAIGTGVTLTQAVASGFLASGPSHVGAALEAMQWLEAILDTLPVEARDPARRPDASLAARLEAAGREAVDRTLDAEGSLLFGFGHPLFVADPRPPHLRALLTARGFGGPASTLADACCARAGQRKGLNPNIDFLSAATLLDLGVASPSWGVGLGLSARIAAMVAHAVERRQRPAFGVNSATARRLLAAVPVGWL
ncbi:citrate/2-methylcitrate synthase [Burkholderia gladioli]|uniref:citrate synthase (unknown stereospecificity) n=6 Tax=Burkholderia gladioli TaxID=28095 RepID=A0A2A7SAZ4_BURGA|nr:citrate/2-methylcitrate synthase [Burkholderia gladioli]ATF88785.1 citrate synthase [Burkholderia gladioli pv. gladioli]MBJ9662407.1 citrate/2-methylcitrate synthase [Burkholderia gladioli]MBJ9715009.1 citrate/2-methylcitrate synthase [Burkholderia gladioli]MBU9426024.1 citrate/2-methylcitrate synthase [Burkholderia gladioli]MCH7273019.1 citrate/2-methylcitrate synthase [Burkholderia gladioli]